MLQYIKGQKMIELNYNILPYVVLAGWVSFTMLGITIQDFILEPLIFKDEQ